MSKESIEFYKLALTMAKQNKPDIATMGSVLSNTASAFQAMNKPQSALKYYQKSLVCANKVNDKETASQAYEKAADLMMNMNRPQKAHSLYKKAMQEALNMKDSQQIRNIKEKMDSLVA
jgi:tetratricopeptide (TPR) repeat protein